MFLDDKLKLIWNEGGCSQSGCTTEVLNLLMQECYSRIDKNNARNSIKRIDASWQLFAKSVGIKTETFRSYFVLNAKCIMEEQGNPYIEKQLRAVCVDLGWNYDKIKL